MMAAYRVTKKALFERRRYHMLTGASARQRFRIVAVCSVSAVVVDYDMSDVNGHEVATEIRRLKPQIPTVMVSSNNAVPKPA
jgi:DNA-binding NtrC family response regulator